MKLICKNCGKRFNSDWRGRKFCSKSCYTNWQKGKSVYSNLVGKRGKRPRRRKISRCVVCGRKFEHLVIRKAKYCSRECWNKRNPKILQDCLYCGKEFWSYKNGNRKFCSNKCSALFRRINQKGAKSHLWKGGKTKLIKLLRTRAEFREWRNAVFQRDNYICQGKNHLPSLPRKSGEGKRVYLHAHHIKPVSEYPELIYKISNGLTLCKNCHLLEHHHKF